MRSQHGGHSTRGTPITSMLAAAVLSAAFVTVQLTPAFAQSPGVTSPAKLARDGYALTRSEAEDIESSLRNKPDDLAARTKLLGFYYPRRDAGLPARRHDRGAAPSHLVADRK